MKHLLKSISTGEVPGLGDLSAGRGHRRGTFAPSPSSSLSSAGPFAFTYSEVFAGSCVKVTILLFLIFSIIPCLFYLLFSLPGASLVAQLVKNQPAMWETWVQSLRWEDPLEKGKATHSSILAWGIPWTV